MLVSKKRIVQFAAAAAAIGGIIGFVMPALWPLVLGVPIVVLFFRIPKMGIVIIALSIGFVRGWSAAPSQLPDIGTTLRGIVVEEPTVADTRFMVRLDSGRRVRVSSQNSVVSFGDGVSLTCTVWTWRSVFEVPSCKAAKVRVLAHHKANVFAYGIHGAASWFEGAIRRGLPSPEAPFLAGLLIGSRSDIPDTLKQQFRTSGTSHIVAVSGFNVTVVVSLIATFIRLLPVPRTVRFCVTTSAIVGFVVLTGASASVVRAGIMSGLVVLARESGRLSDILHVLILSACAMVFVEPRIVADIGFQLSVAATLGLIVLSDRFTNFLLWVPEFGGIRSSLSTTLAAIAMTQPLITLYFRQVSLVAPLVNLVVLPLIPVAMLAGFIVVVVGALLPPLSVYIGWVAWIPLRAIIFVVATGSKAPFASIQMSTAVSLALAATSASIVWWFITFRSRTYET